MWRITGNAVPDEELAKKSLARYFAIVQKYKLLKQV
jgi:hypothetical protein